MSNNKIKFRQQGPRSASLDSRSFCVMWSRSDSLDEVYQKVEDAWSKQHIQRVDRKTFYTSRKVGYSQLRARATKARNRGVPLRSLQGEESTTTYGRVDYDYLASLVEQINEETQSATQTTTGLKDSYTRYRSENKD